MMGKFLYLGRRVSGDIFLCIGGGLLLTAVGGVAGNLPDILKYRDWPPSEIHGLCASVAVFAVSGVAFLIPAYVLLRSRGIGLARSGGDGEPENQSA